MTPESVMMMGTEAMKVALWHWLPAIVGSVGHGPVVSILQAATQIDNDAVVYSENHRGLLSIFLPDRGCSICCWITSTPCSLTCRI
ncbi:flagellar biosynthetic protein FliQ [Shigella boydii]